LIIFFDDYANTMLLGNTLRPLCDKLKISREKLAYVVDSTAAPVAGLALVSTWIAVELAYVQDGINNLPTAQEFNAFDLFIASIPYRFYVLMALCFVPLVAILGREFGPMLVAERRRLESDQVDPVHTSAGVHYPTEPEEHTPPRWFNAVIPIGVTLTLVVSIIYQSGYAALAADPEHTDFGLRAIFGAANSSIALQYGALAGLLVTAALCRLQRLLPPMEVLEAAAQGARVVIPAVVILWSASSISRMTGNKSVDGLPSTTPYEYQDHRLYTGDFLKDVLVGTATDENGSPTEPRFSAQLLPTVVFLLSSVVAFCTGTSFGTMGILLPMVVPLAYTLISAEGQLVDANNPLLLCSIGGVLAGAVFGDHCSPISDTTVLSSQSSGCDHIAHVWTQMPYAVSVATVSILLGTIPLGWGLSVWVLLPAQLAVLVFILLLAGRRV
jgi:Na+/H+ antiporter NhaC